MLVATTLVMALVGLIAAAGFVVVAQRRQRQLGLLAAIGATERHLRLVMVANGAIVGVVAAAVGSRARRPRLDRRGAGGRGRGELPHRPVRPALGADRGSARRSPMVMATAAAWWPARNLGRTSVMGGGVGTPAPAVCRSTDR